MASSRFDLYLDFVLFFCRPGTDDLQPTVRRSPRNHTPGLEIRVESERIHGGDVASRATARHVSRPERPAPAAHPGTELSRRSGIARSSPETLRRPNNHIPCTERQRNTKR